MASLSDVVFNVAALVVFSVTNSGCQMESMQTVTEFCSNSKYTQIKDGGYQTLLFSPTTYYAGGLALSILSRWFFDLTIVIFNADDNQKNKRAFYAGSIFLDVLVVVYIIIMLGVSGGNGSLGVWWNNQLAEMITIIVWSLYRVVISIVDITSLTLRIKTKSRV